MTDDFMKYAREVTPRRAFKWYLIGILGLFGIGVALFVMRVVLAPVNLANNALTQAGRVVDKTIDADNVLHNYEWFYDTSRQIDARVQQIGVHAGLFRSESDAAERNRLRIELTTMQQSCRDMAAKYNANTAKANRAIFRGGDAPESIDLTTCEVKL